MNRILRAKIKVWNIDAPKSTVQGEEDKTSYEYIRANAVYSEDKSSENYAFSVATPSLELSMNINNPNAFGLLEQGKEYYLDFVPVQG